MKSESQGGTRHQYFVKLPKGFQVADKSRNHRSSERQRHNHLSLGVEEIHVVTVGLSPSVVTSQMCWVPLNIHTQCILVRNGETHPSSAPGPMWAVFLCSRVFHGLLSAGLGHQECFFREPSLSQAPWPPAQYLSRLRSQRHFQQ